MLRFALLLALLTGTCGLLLATSTDADACAAVPRLNEPSITIAQESAIIVWNPVKKVQHFIRRAAFDTKSPDFGFLVPTPTPPKVPFDVVEDSIFQAADSWLTPKIVEQTRWKFEPLLCGFFLLKSEMRHVGALAEPKDSVRVLHEQKVGGFETVVLEADKTEDLSNWLTKNGYSNDPELQSWLVPYVGAKWTITAFKIMQDPKTGGLATTKAVRMSFATERPFFPYREPEAKSDKDIVKFKQKEKPTPTEIDGIWKVESAAGDPKDADHLKGTTFWFGDGISVGRFMKDLPFTVDATKEPKWLDLHTMQGIYKLEGDTLYWCRGKKARPSSFDAKEGVLLVLRRDAKAEGEKVAAEVVARKHEQLNSGSRLLRVHFVSDVRFEGKLGDQAWHAHVHWSDQLTSDQRLQIAKETGVSPDDLPANSWLTTFDDRASPRPGKDEVNFDPAKDQTPIRPQVIRFHDTWIPIDVIILGVVLLFLAVGGVVFVWKASRRST